jgi:hypothetical protein
VAKFYSPVVNLPVTPVLDILIKLINFNLNLIIVAWGYSVDLFFFSLYQLPLVGTPWIFHVYYDRGDNLPHDQIRCHVKLINLIKMSRTGVTGKFTTGE